MGRRAPLLTPTLSGVVLDETESTVSVWDDGIDAVYAFSPDYEGVYEWT